ncbi:Uncharacterized protein TPAR_01769 [Tolypocladium paradoxum]|uniref:Uncharacterized protein n=1 Tax=Tolypocladium paradoxum TaxID=94208 RepID=A0A2S4L6L2_9HYPO|nr:Uncharacterized protein TPAR_01769 [Tolypocladium paradoxum]
MASPTGSQAAEPVVIHEDEMPAEGDAALSDHKKRPQTDMRTPEPQVDQQSADSDTPSTPGHLAPFDWDEFEARYEKALREADDHEREILKEAEGLSKYFQAWASAASAHDDERAVKRLRTRQRFVNLSEEKAAQKQQHYEEVVRAFESALALLQANHFQRQYLPAATGRPVAVHVWGVHTADMSLLMVARDSASLGTAKHPPLFSNKVPRPCTYHNMAAAKWEMPPGGPPMSSVRCNPSIILPSLVQCTPANRYQEDWAAFDQTHFSSEAVANFGQTFQNPAAFQQTHRQPEYHDWAEEDDLGYYEDGVKRTLTDEQIEMFRQSELRELRRLQAKGLRPQSATPQEGSANDSKQSPPQRQEANPPWSTRGTTKKKKKGVKNARYEPKPDLRKRTWDVVEQGLDTLDYD